jgi:hypothetical protein
MEQILEIVQKQNDAILTLSEKINELVAKIDVLTVENKKTVDAVVEKKKLAKIINVVEDGDFVCVKGEYQTTSKIKDVLKGNGARWDRTKKVWKFVDMESDDVLKLVQDTCKLMKLTADVRLEKMKSNIEEDYEDIEV